MRRSGNGSPRLSGAPHLVTGREPVTLVVFPGKERSPYLLRCDDQGVGGALGYRSARSRLTRCRCPACRRGPP